MLTKFKHLMEAQNTLNDWRRVAFRTSRQHSTLLNARQLYRA